MDGDSPDASPTRADARAYGIKKFNDTCRSKGTTLSASRKARCLKTPLVQRYQPPPISGVFSRLQFFGFGRDEPTREDGRTAEPVFSTSRPPAALENANGGFCVSFRSQTHDRNQPHARKPAGYRSTRTLDYICNRSRDGPRLTSSSSFRARMRNSEVVRDYYGRILHSLSRSFDALPGLWGFVDLKGRRAGE